MQGLAVRLNLKRSQGRPRAGYAAAKRVEFRGADLVPLKSRQHPPRVNGLRTRSLAQSETRVVKKLKRRRVMHRQYKCFGRPVRYISMNAMVGAVRGTVNELGSRPSLRHGDGGPRAAGAQRISGRRKPHPEGQAEWTPQALGRRASHTPRDWPSPRPQGSRRGRNGGAARHYPGLVPQACRPQVRWLEGP